MTDLATAKRTMEAKLGVTFQPAKVGGQSCLAADVSDQYEMTERVRPLAVEAERAGYLLFVGYQGDAHRLFLVPGVDSLDIIRIFRVGTHNQAKDAWKAVDRALRKIHAEAPFSVYFADAAGYRGAFATKPDENAAKQFEDLVLSVDPEALALVDDGEIWRPMTEDGILQLWWD